MKLRLATFIVTLILGIAPAVRADLEVQSLGSTPTITFDSTLVNVNEGAFTGGGFKPTPDSGELDSNSRAVTGVSDGSLAFDGTQDPPLFFPNDFARGDGGEETVSEGGIYGFDIVDDNNGPNTNRVLGVQPNGDDFTPGSITLRVLNDTGFSVANWNISYNAFSYNKTVRSNSIEFSWSADDISYTSVPELDYSSPTTQTIGDINWSAAASRSTTIALTSALADGARLYLRWTFNDVSGTSSSRDQFAIDDISVIAAVPEPGAFLFGVLICCAVGLAAVSRHWIRSQREVI